MAGPSPERFTVTAPGAHPVAPDHVLIVGDFADINGGQAKVAIESAILLAESGVAVTFFAACGPVHASLDHPRIRVVCLHQPTILDDPNRLRAIVTGIWNARAARALRRTMATLDPERTLIHVHGYAKALSPAIGPVLARGGFPTLFTMHEFFLACPNGGFYDYRRHEICTRKPLGASCLATNCDVRHAAHKAWRVVRGAAAQGPGGLPRRLRHLAYISERQKTVMAPHLPRGATLHKILNPVAAGGPPVAARGNETLVFLGRLSPEKGALLLARAARDAGMPVLFIGDGAEADAIRAENPKAEITGWLPPQAAQARLAEARALVFPSLWHEVQGMVTIEALLRGIPVVCGRWSAAAEVVEDGVNGVLFDAPRPDSLAGALRRLDEIGPFDSAALAARVSPEAHLARLRAVYADVMADR